MWLRLWVSHFGSSHFSQAARCSRAYLWFAWCKTRTSLIAASSQRSLGLSFSADLSGSSFDPDGFSDDMSEDLAPFSVNVPLLPARGHFAASGPLSYEFLQCCSLPTHLQCITDLVHESSQSVDCPACNAQSPSSADFLHFQHFCCIHHVEAPAGECMICSGPQSMASSFSVPCCRQRIHYECLPVLSEPSSGGLLRTHRHSQRFSTGPANSALNSLSLCP